MNDLCRAFLGKDLNCKSGYLLTGIYTLVNSQSVLMLLLSKMVSFNSSVLSLAGSKIIILKGTDQEY